MLEDDPLMLTPTPAPSAIDLEALMSDENKI